MSTVKADYLVNAAGTGSPTFSNGIKSDTITNAAGSGAPTFTYGAILAGTTTVSGGTSNWTVVASGTNLTFAYGGVNKFRIDSSGNLTVTGNVTAYGTIT